ncbi:hypothetical protein SK128_016141 [Halocaridina rubra]|uniref:Methyltransferase domain-containing protein n=1 Tax=Halocaridina rubra TaxID=373956 RepID=A0AAN8XCE3_HALRR
MKAVCLDPELNITAGNCHVLSFGINNEWSFDDAFANYGCKVFAFDPTMGVNDHQRSKNVQFFNLGIGNIKGWRKVGMLHDFDYFQVDRYENILQRLGLINTIIDYIKMDVELSELEFLQDVIRNSPHLLKNIKQIAMEAHHGYNGEGVMLSPVDFPDMSPMSAFQLFWEYFHELECHGFKLLHSHQNIPWTEAVWGRIQDY